MKIYWYSFFCCIFLVDVSRAKPHSKLPKTVVTVWVHGTHPAKRLLESKISPIRSQVSVPAGLSLAKDAPEHYYFHNIAQECYKKDPEEYNIENFYTFGWNSAKITSRQRKKVGKELFNDIEQLLKKYKEKYKIVQLRLIGFSHGGNVILNCMSHLPFACKDIETEAILIATPIQESNRWYVNTPYVNRVYSLYSDKDWIQRIDVQKFHRDAPRHTPLLSGRRFANTDRVIQVNFRFNGKAIGHIGFRPVMKYIPDIIRKIKEQLDTEQNRKHIGLNFIA